MKKSIDIGTVKITRNPKVGCKLFVQSPILARFFKNEAANQGVAGQTRVIHYGSENQAIDVLALNGPDYSSTMPNYDYHVHRSVTNGDYTFLLSPDLATGVTISLNGPLAEDTARSCVSSLSSAIRDLYLRLVRSYVVETTIVLTRDDVLEGGEA